MGRATAALPTTSSPRPPPVGSPQQNTLPSELAQVREPPTASAVYVRASLPVSLAGTSVTAVGASSGHRPSVCGTAQPIASAASARLHHRTSRAVDSRVRGSPSCPWRVASAPPQHTTVRPLTTKHPCWRPTESEVNAPVGAYASASRKPSRPVGASSPHAALEHLRSRPTTAHHGAPAASAPTPPAKVPSTSPRASPRHPARRAPAAPASRHVPRRPVATASTASPTNTAVGASTAPVAPKAAPSPQQRTPSPPRAQVCSKPAWSDVTAPTPATTRALVLHPLPPCPHAARPPSSPPACATRSLPQHHTRPAASSAQVWRRPAAIAVTPLGPATRTKPSRRVERAVAELARVVGPRAPHLAPRRRHAQVGRPHRERGDPVGAGDPRGPPAIEAVAEHPARPRAPAHQPPRVPVAHERAAQRVAHRHREHPRARAVLVRRAVAVVVDVVAAALDGGGRLQRAPARPVAPRGAVLRPRAAPPDPERPGGPVVAGAGLVAARAAARPLGEVAHTVAVLVVEPVAHAVHVRPRRGRAGPPLARRVARPPRRRARAAAAPPARTPRRRPARTPARPPPPAPPRSAAPARPRGPAARGRSRRVRHRADGDVDALAVVVEEPPVGRVEAHLDRRRRPAPRHLERAPRRRDARRRAPRSTGPRPPPSVRF